jgi:thiol-disulfide isomerase/thioredoxin
MPILFTARNLLIGLALAWLLAFALTQPTAPDVVFTDLEGAKMSTKSLYGKVVLVNFWATSCSYCVAEMPQMAALYNQYKDQNFEFIAVAMAYDPPNYVLDYVETRKIPFKVALDVNGGLAKAFGEVNLVPSTFIIGKNGKIIEHIVGQPAFADLHKILKKALAA